MFNLADRYRSFRAHHNYNHPRLFVVLAYGKTLLEFALVFSLLWYGLPKLMAKVSPDETKQIQVPAAASTADIQNLTLVATTYPVDSSKPVSAGMRNTDWLLVQNGSSYVVQLASSTDKNKLYQKAMELSQSHPAVVFPFKKTRSNQVMYGYSLGLYGSLEEAQESIAGLDAATVQEGVWIRQLDELQPKIRNLQ